MATLTVSQKINIAKISQFLAAIDIKKGGLYGSGIDLLLPRKLYNVRKSVENQYLLNAADTTLTSTSNYLYALCNKYALVAQAITIGGGTVASISGNTYPPRYDFMVAASGTFLVDGDSTKIITAFIGYNLLFVRGNITQSIVNLGDGSSYFSWSKDTGSFTAVPAVTTGEIIQLYPV